MDETARESTLHRLKLAHSDQGWKPTRMAGRFQMAVGRLSEKLIVEGLMNLPDLMKRDQISW